MYNQFDVADRLIERGEDVSQRDKTNLTYVYYLLKYGQYHRFQSLSQKKAFKLDMQFNGLTLLDVAAQYGHPALITLINKRYTSFNLQHITGWELIHYYIKANDVSIVIPWLQSATDIFYPIQTGADTGKTTAYIAAEHGALECLQAILTHKDAKKAGITKALLYAAMLSGKTEIIDVVLKYDNDINQPLDSQQHSVGHLAVKFGLLQLIKFLQRCGCDFTLKNTLNLTAFHLAIDNDDADMLLALLKYHEPSAWPVDLLAFAVSKGKDACVQVLKAEQAKRQYCFEDGSMIALQDACKAEKYEQVMSFLQRKLNLNTKTNEGHYLLHNAIKTGSMEIVAALLQHGADPKLEQDELDAYAFAVKYQQIAIIRLMQQMGFAPSISLATDRLYSSLANHNPYILAALQGKYADYEETQQQLLAAIDEVDDIKFTNLLASFPAYHVSISANGLSQPILHWAFAKNAEWAIRILIDHGADVHCKDSDGLGIIHKIPFYQEEDGKWLLSMLDKYFPSYKNALHKKNPVPDFMSLIL